MTVASNNKGWLSSKMPNWVGPADDEIEFVGRFENLIPDLVAALIIFNEKFDTIKLAETPRENVSCYETFPTEWTTEMKEAILDSEKEMIERFYRSS
jgi:hypothetical protein